MSIYEQKVVVDAFFEETVNEIARKCGLKDMEYLCLGFYYENPTRNTASEFVKARHATKSHVSTTISSLCERGLLRQYQKETDAKKIFLEVTEKGKELFASSIGDFDEYLAQVTKGFSKEDLELYNKLNERIYENSLEGLQKKKKTI